MDPLLEFIGSFNFVDAKLFEQGLLKGRKRIEIYKKIQELEQGVCSICYKDPKKVNDYCDNCDTMKEFHDCKKEEGTERSAKFVEKCRNWREMFDNRQMLKIGFRLGNFFRLVVEEDQVEILEAPAAAATMLRIGKEKKVELVRKRPSRPRDEDDDDYNSADGVKKQKQKEGKAKSPGKKLSGVCKFAKCRVKAELLCEEHKDTPKCIKCPLYLRYLTTKPIKICKRCEVRESKKGANDEEKKVNNCELYFEKLKSQLMEDIIYENKFANTLTDRRHVWCEMEKILEGAHMDELETWCKKNKNVNGAIMLCYGEITRVVGESAADKDMREYKNILEDAIKLEEESKLNHGEGHLLLGNYYYLIGKEKQGSENYEKAAVLDNSEAMYWLNYYDDDGGKRKWLLKSAEYGHFRAYSELTDLEIRGILQVRMRESEGEFNKWRSCLKSSGEKDAVGKIEKVLLDLSVA
ncbi:MAG: hypothetical protein Harvfovirus2_32 [Harvfovirus sp.]|uniref:Uncharacterized protein n=1 Tax=Harvfovirus sp. TaxID=2487768 RepID=A0A3G5A027_9VIRU|nr:MAG: hypothetical protein Harvfovirus2_32 [Harvfovirus sp.]